MTLHLPPNSVRLAVLGANGRMGRTVVRLAHAAGMHIVCAVGAGDEGRDAGELAGIGPIGIKVVADAHALVSSRANVVIDFSAPAALVHATTICAGAGIAIVSGTTGLDDVAKGALDVAALKSAVLWEPNMSIGVHVLTSLVEKAMEALGPSFDVEVVEVHHRAKVDAPSGTAIRLGDVVKHARHGHYVHGREGGPATQTRRGRHACRSRR